MSDAATYIHGLLIDAIHWHLLPAAEREEAVQIQRLTAAIHRLQQLRRATRDEPRPPPGIKRWRCVGCQNVVYFSTRPIWCPVCQGRVFSEQYPVNQEG
jgi:rubrerythrin